jgi:1,4-alpha-glucan branching enzyme
VAEVTFKDMDSEAKKEFFKKLSVYGKMPIDWFPYGQNTESTMKKEIEEKFAKESSKKAQKFSLIKQYKVTGSLCKVTFRLSKEAAADAQKVTIVGDFNGWNKEDTSMTRLSSGDFGATIKLEAGREYRFRYLINGDRWENDGYADRYEPNPFGWHDSVVVV